MNKHQLYVHFFDGMDFASDLAKRVASAWVERNEIMARHRWVSLALARDTSKPWPRATKRG